MGLRRLRQRLDQVQGAANLTLQDARDLVEDLRDGFGVTLELDVDKAKEIFRMALVGGAAGKITLPLTVKIDPTVDTKEPK